MTPDQLTRLQGLSVKLAEVFLDEADPDTWSGAGVSTADMSREERGDRVWCKKNAVATLALLNGVVVLANHRDGDAVPEMSDDLDERISSAEERAATLMDAIIKKASARAH